MGQNFHICLWSGPGAIPRRPVLKISLTVKYPGSFMSSQKNPCVLVRINITRTSTESNTTQYLHKKQVFTKGKSNVRVVKINFGKSCWLGLWLCLRLMVRWEKHKRREFQLLARWHQWWWHQDRVGTGGTSCQERGGDISVRNSFQTGQEGISLGFYERNVCHRGPLF